MSWILLTNDDGVDSPALVPFARALRDRLGEVRVVVPDDERSWVGKAITRFEPIDVEVVDREGVEIHACTGYPADAVQLGVHTLFDDGPPRLVVSGINLGYNHGAAFLLSSGTVGAAIEGWISGVPGVAFSAGHEGDFRAWQRSIRAAGARSDWERLAHLCTDVLEELIEAAVPTHADVVSVNVPWRADADTPRRVTAVARVGYDRLFERTADGFSHAFGGFVHREDVEGSDVDAAGDGVVSITPLAMPAAVPLPTATVSRLERRG